MIPSTRQAKPHRRAEGFPFAAGELWRPLRLILDDDTLTADERAELLAFEHYDEVELTRTARDARPRLEVQEPEEDFVPIQTIGNGVGVSWVPHAAGLRSRAEEVSRRTGISADDAYRAIVFAFAAEEAKAD